MNVILPALSTHFMVIQMGRWIDTQKDKDVHKHFKKTTVKDHT